MLTEENVIPNRGAATPEDIAYSDEMLSLVQFALEGLDSIDREAFILHGIEGFSVEEICVHRPQDGRCGVFYRQSARTSPPFRADRQSFQRKAAPRIRNRLTRI
jgi:hypothetical protein